MKIFEKPMAFCKFSPDFRSKNGLELTKKRRTETIVLPHSPPPNIVINVGRKKFIIVIRVGTKKFLKSACFENVLAENKDVNCQASEILVAHRKTS